MAEIACGGWTICYILAKAKREMDSTPFLTGVDSTNSMVFISQKFTYMSFGIFGHSHSPSTLRRLDRISHAIFAV